jgi:hypothetical protein
MQPHSQTDTAPPPRVFNYSLDWRFFLPMANLHKGYFLFEEDEDFSQTLAHIGIHVSQRLSLLDIRHRKNDSFPLFVMPFGLPSGWMGAGYKNRVEVYSSIRHLIDSGGYLLVGFNNALNWSNRSQRKYHFSTPPRMEDELRQAGFNSVKILGAMPDLQIPEYIFDLSPQTIQFALQNRFRRKPAVLRALNLLAGTVSLKRISRFLPCYFAVAAV